MRGEKRNSRSKQRYDIHVVVCYLQKDWLLKEVTVNVASLKSFTIVVRVAILILYVLQNLRSGPDILTETLY